MSRTTSPVARRLAAVAATSAALLTPVATAPAAGADPALSVGSIDEGSVNTAILQSSAALGASPASLRSLYLCVLPHPSTEGTCLY